MESLSHRSALPILVAVGTVLLAGCTATPSAREQLERNAKVVAVSTRPPQGSGPLTIWMRVDAKIGDEVREYYLPYVGHDQYVPAVGVVCDIRYAFQKADGEFWKIEPPRHKINVVRDLRCK